MCAEKAWWEKFPPHGQWLRGPNMSGGTGIIELTEPSDTLTYKPIFKHCILQTILHIYICVEQNLLL